MSVAFSTRLYMEIGYGALPATSRGLGTVATTTAIDRRSDTTTTKTQDNCVTINSGPRKPAGLSRVPTWAIEFGVLFPVMPGKPEEDYRPHHCWI